MSVSERASWWTKYFVRDVNIAIVNLLPDEQQDLVYKELRSRPEESRNLQEHLQYIRSLGYHFDELQAFQAVLSCFGVVEHSHRFLSWLACEYLPRFQKTADRLEALECTIRELYERTATLVHDLSTSVTVDDCGFPVSDAEEGMRQLRATLSAQKNLFALGYDSIIPAANLETSAETRHSTLRSRVDSLEQLLKESRDKMEFYQPITQGEELAARVQALESKINELQPPFSMFSDASISSTCTLTPASTIVNEREGERDGFDNAEEASAVPLKLCIQVHKSGPISLTDRLHVSLEHTQPIIVKMYPHTPFKLLADKLQKSFGDRELRMSEHPCEYVFDSDTPASLGLKNDAKLIYANIYFGSKTIDLTVL